MGEPRRPPPLHVDDARLLPLASGLLLFAPFALLANEVSSLLRYPELGSAVLFLPYAVLTAALVASPVRDWVWYILVGALLHGAVCAFELRHGHRCAKVIVAVLVSKQSSQQSRRCRRRAR